MKRNSKMFLFIVMLLLTELFFNDQLSKRL